MIELGHVVYYVRDLQNDSAWMEAPVKSLEL